MSTFLCGHILTFILGIYLEIELDHMVSMLTILRNGQIVFQGGCTILYFTRISISPHLYQHVIICLFLNFSDPNGYEISYCVLKLLLLNANHAEHFCKSF